MLNKPSIPVLPTFRSCILSGLPAYLERCMETEDGAALLDGDHVPRGKRLAVTDVVHPVDDGHCKTGVLLMLNLRKSRVRCYRTVFRQKAAYTR